MIKVIGPDEKIDMLMDMILKNNLVHKITITLQDEDGTVTEGVIVPNADGSITETVTIRSGGEETTTTTITPREEQN